MEKKKQTIVPMPGYALVEVLSQDKIGNLYVVKDERDNVPTYGKVIATKENIYDPEFEMNSTHESILHLSSPVKVGDYIYFKKYAGQDFSHDGVELCFVPWKDIMGVEK